jgi:hypothetical protein
VAVAEEISSASDVAPALLAGLWVCEGPTGGAAVACDSTSDAMELLNAGIVMIASLKGKRREALSNFAPWFCLAYSA